MATLTMSDGGGIVLSGPYFKTQTQLPGERVKKKKRSECAFLFILAVHLGGLKTASKAAPGTPQHAVFKFMPQPVLGWLSP